MHEIIFDVVVVIVGLAALVITRYLVPWLKLHISVKQLDELTFWAQQGTFYAQQFLDASDTLTRKEAVFDFLKALRNKESLPFTDDQLEILIEAAVKQMKMDEMAVEEFELEDDIEYLDEEDDAE